VGHLHGDECHDLGSFAFLPVLVVRFVVVVRWAVVSAADPAASSGAPYGRTHWSAIDP